ncbi:MAG: hypothetical protein Q7T41_03720 [Candidatus Saccharibacteria bacterium]|nr:hypothetical protein [Candidatus Saccharibacteria bacterium]
MSQPFRHPEFDILGEKSEYPNLASVCGLLTIAAWRKIADLCEGTTTRQNMSLPTDEQCADRVIDVAAVTGGVVAFAATIVHLPLL